MSRRFLLAARRRLKTVEYWVTAKLLLMALRVFRLLPLDPTLNAMDRIGRTLGPLSGRHRLALDNLRKAYPELPESELKKIALDMWGNMSRLVVEYVFLDRIVAGGIGPGPENRVEVEGVEFFLRIKNEETPHMLFSAHMGAFEILNAAVASYDVNATVLFRRPNNPYVADELTRMRNVAMGPMEQSRPGVSFALARILGEGGNVGVLVDQKFRNGIPTTFFGRACESSPLVAEADAPVRAGRLRGALHPAAEQPLPHRHRGRARTAA